MELSLSLGLRTLNIAPFVEGLIFYRGMCLEFRYEDEKVLGTQSHPTHGSASTHCIPNINLIKDNFNMLF